MLLEFLATITVATSTVTGYSEIDSCHYANCAMANGERAHVGAVACPRKYDFNTIVIINGSLYQCSDRTALRHDGRFDIFMGYGKESYKKAIDFGKQEKKVYIIDEW